jgi:hypothetical protein
LQVETLHTRYSAPQAIGCLQRLQCRQVARASDMAGG